MKPLSVQPLANGHILLAGAPQPYGAANSTPVVVAELDAAGTYLPAATPTVQQPGRVADVVRQPDGKLVVGGEFNELNGAAALNLIRLLPDGTPDGTFMAACSDAVSSLALQTDGRLVLGGRFRYVNGQAHFGLARLLPTGALDAGFASPLLPAYEGAVDQVFLQPNGNILLVGALPLRVPSNGRTTYLARVLGSTGQVDHSFLPADSATYARVLVQPDGRILASGWSSTLLPGSSGLVLVWRMQPSGALDNSFVLTPVNAQSIEPLPVLALDATGRVYVSGQFASFGPVTTSHIARLLPNGTPDASFVASSGLGTVLGVTALAMQPNGRLLAGGSLFSNNTFYGLLRLLPNGRDDTSFSPAVGPAPLVAKLLIQPDGAVIAAGSFEQAGGLPIAGLVRLLDSNVLSILPAQQAARLEAWPVPSHGTLHLRLEAGQRPSLVQLLDVLGRTVQQVTSAAPAEVTLDTSLLAPGVYLIRVVYGNGTVASRRVAVR